MTARRAGGDLDRWELRVVAVLPDGSSEPLVVDAAPDARVGDLLDALGAAAVFRPDGSRPSPELPLEAAGFRHGDTMRVAMDDAPPADDDTDAAVVELVVPDGRWRLGVGRHTVGRGSGCTVRLSDPSVSRLHATVTVGGGPGAERVVVTDERSTNGSSVAGVELAGATPLGLPATVVMGEVDVRLAHADVVDSAVHHPLVALPVQRGWVRLPRPPATALPVGEVLLDAPAAPPAAPRPKFGWLTAGAPVLLAVVVVVVSLVAAPAGLDGSYLWLTVAFLLLSPLLVVAGHVEARRTWRSDRSRAVAEFEAGLATLDAPLDAARREEVRRRCEAHPAPAELHERVRRVDPRLWEDPAPGRGIGVRLGTGPARSSVVVRDADGGDPDAVAAVSERRDRARRLDGVPVVVATPCVVGVVGSVRAVADVASWLVLQAATTVPPSRLRVDVVATAEHESEWAWLDWLGRVPGRDGSRVARRRPAEVASVVDGWRGLDAPGPGALRLLAVDADEVGPSALASMAEAAGASGVTVVVGARHRTGLPAACDVVVELGAPPDAGVAVGRVSWPAEGRSMDARVDAVGPVEAMRWARALAALGESGAIRPDGAGLPATVALGDLVDGDPALDDVTAATDRWATPPPGLTVTLGADADGPVRVDLRRDGPHTMVAGTTGAGKSELLRTMVLTAAAAYPPERLQVLLVDFKGGAAFGACAALPHSVGVVSDLDGGLAERVLVSLGAELRRRERLLAEAGHASLTEAEAEAAGRGEGMPPPFPNLMVVVDEFAAVTAEVPGFVDGMIDIGRRGRSLGLHLVLATQRPTGIVNDHLRANVSIRLALRVADPQDSVDVVGIADAAAIPNDLPGRAWMCIGDGGASPLQSAWCGARSPVGIAPPAGRRGRRGRPRVELRAMRAVRGEVSPRPLSDERDLDRLVATLVAAAAGRPPPASRPWIDPLPAAVALESLLASRSGATGGVLLGLADEPDVPAQGPCEIDLGARGALGVVGGASWVGDVLRSVALSAVLGRSPDVVRLDVVDASPGDGWAPLCGLPQLGSVVRADDHERVERLVRDLDRAIRDGSHRGGARVLVVDHLGAMVAAAERAGAGTVDSLARIVADGATVGVHVVVSADRRAAVPMSIWGGLGVLAVGAMSTPDEFEACAFGARRPAPIPGRVVVDSVEVQCATVDRDAVARLVRSERVRFGSRAHVAVGRLPDDVTAAGPGSVRGDRPADGALVVGVDDRDLGPAIVDLRAGNLLVAGPMGSGRSTALRTIARALAAGSTARSPRVLVTARAMAPAEPWDEVWSGAEAGPAVDALVAGLERGADRPWTSSDPVVFVDDATELDDDVSAALERLARVSAAGAVRLVVAAEAGPARQSYGGVVARVRRERRALLLQPDRELDGDLAGVRLPWRGPRAWPPGRGELVVRGEIRLVQLAR